MDTQTNRQAETGRQADRSTDTQPHSRTDSVTERATGRSADECARRQTCRRRDGEINKELYRRAKKRQTNIWNDFFILFYRQLQWVTGQNGIGQNGTDKMVRTKWHGQNGSNFYRFQFK